MKRRYFAIVLAVGLLLALGGCGKTEAPAEEPVIAPKPIVVPTPEPQPVVPTGTNPLTGLPMEEIFEENRPVAVMFNNLKVAQPQLGVSQADIIYEVVAEGGITRMLGVFQTLEGVGNLGTIRSTRPYYLELALGHDALLVHGGGSPAAYENIHAWGVDNMDGVNGGSDAEIFWRDAARRKIAGYEHSMLTSGENVLGYLAKGRFPTEHDGKWQYPQTFVEDGTPKGGDPASQITLKFSPDKTGVFAYDTASKQYRVSQYGGAYIDGNSGQQVGVTNLLVLETAISVIPGDLEGRLSVKLTGEGKGTYFCGGQTVPIRWSKDTRNSPFRYTLEDGTPLALGRGTSYVCIITPKISTLSWT